MGRVVVDTSVLVALTDSSDAHYWPARHAISAARRDSEFWISTLSLSELMGGLFRGHARTDVLERLMARVRVSFYLFMLRAPKANAEEVYRVLLRKNLRSFAMKYALDADGDVWLAAELPLRGFDGEELDRILGVFHQESESAFEALVHLGFP